MRVQSLVWEDPLKKDMATHTPVFLHGESHGQRGLMGSSPQGHKESCTTEHASTSGITKWPLKDLENSRSSCSASLFTHIWSLFLNCDDRVPSVLGWDPITQPRKKLPHTYIQWNTTQL